MGVAARVASGGMTSTDRPTFPHRDEHGRVVSLTELLVASLSSCHMLWYLVLCVGRKIPILASYAATTAWR